jgi:hypothetical protein
MAVASSSFQPSRIGLGSICGDHLRARPQRAELDVRAAQAEDLADVVVERRVAGHRGAGAEQLLVAARPVGVAAAGMREQALLAREHRRVRGARGARTLTAGARGRRRTLLLAGAGRVRRDGVARGHLELGLQLLRAGLLLRRLRGRVGRGDLAEVRVGVLVAVGVLEHDVVAERAAASDLADDAVVDRDHRRARARVDVDRAPLGVRVDRDRGVAGPHAPGRAGLVEVVGVGGAGGDGEVAFGEAGEGADEVGGHAADELGAEDDGLDVPVGVVVGEDGLVDVLVAAGGAQVAPGGEDRVDGVVGVLLAVAVGVHAVGAPGGGDELHPSERPGGGDTEVPSVVGLDLVDRRQYLPRDAVLRARRLVDRQQERRDPELLDEEIRHPHRRRAGIGQREGGVVDRR